MISIAVTVDTVSPMLAGMSERAADLSVPIRQFGNLLLSDAYEAVAVHKAGPGGETWAPMAASTIKRGRDPETLLIETGALLGSLAEEGPGNVIIVGPSEGFFGTEVGEAIFHQDGQGRMHRPFFGIAPQRFGDGETIFAGYMTGQGGE